MPLEQADIDALNEAIVDNAQKPRSASTGAVSASQHSIDDQIKAANHAAAQLSANRNSFGLRFTRLIPGPRQ